MWRLVCLLVLVNVSSAFAADVASYGRATEDLPQYVHRSWRRAEGLPQDTVSAIVQTRDGYLWLGTQEGLVRFDGVTFTLFNKGTTPAFTHNEVAALAEGPDGALWVGTFGGLLRYANGRFTAFPTGTNREREVVSALAVGRDGTVWVGTQSGGVNVLERERYRFLDRESGLPSLSVEGVTIDDTGVPWIATPEGAARLGSVVRVFTEKDGLPSARTREVYAARGAVWVGTDDGLARVVGNTVDVPAGYAGPSGPVTAFRQDRSGGLWVGTEAGVVWRLGGDSPSSRRLAPELSINRVEDILEDREGNVWVGTYTSGLHRLWRGRFGSLTSAQGLRGPSLRAIRQSRDGSVWLTTEGDGIARFDGRRVVNYSVADGLPDDVARALYEDRQGVLWAGTRDGLARFDGRRFVAVDGTRGHYIRALAEDGRGTLWVGTRDQVYRLEGSTLVGVAEDRRTPLPRGTVRTLFRDKDGAMWVGTNDALVRIVGSDVRRFESKDGLPADAIYCIHQDADGTMWLGSYGGGITRLKGGRFHRFRQADGLFDDVAYQILEDDGGHLWVSCNNGVYRVRKADLDAFAGGTIARIPSVSFDASDGMPSGECNGNAQPAGWKMADGRLWFPTTAGAAIIDPSRAETGHRPPLVVVESMVAGRENVPVTGEPGLAAGTGQVAFTYTGLSFVAPGRIRFRHRLEGLDKDWVEAGTRRQIGYSNLAPGRYVFQVAASNTDGVWSEAPASVVFQLEPHFYQTIWFRGLLALGGVGLVLGGYRIRTWRLVQRERELSARVDQALGRIKVLGGLIPICANCKNVRDDTGYWRQLELYVKTHSQAEFSHGICPDCMRELYPDYQEGDSEPPSPRA